MNVYPGVLFCYGPCQDSQLPQFVYPLYILIGSAFDISAFLKLFCPSLASSGRASRFCLSAEHSGRSYFFVGWTCLTNTFYFSMNVLFIFIFFVGFIPSSIISYISYFYRKIVKNMKKYIVLIQNFYILNQMNFLCYLKLHHV